MATRKVTAMATRKRTPSVSLVHQPITKPRQVIAKKSSVITPEDELAVVAMEIDDAQDSFEEWEDRSDMADRRGPYMAGRRLEKWLALLESYPMDVILSKYEGDIAKEMAGTKITHQLDIKEHMARLCAVVLLAQERCSQG